MKTFIILCFCLISIGFADAPVIDRPIFSGPGVGLGATVTASSMDSIYGKILQYNYQYLALTELEAIESRVIDPVFWEFHAGIGAYAPKQMYKVGFIGCKLNLSSGKITDAKRLKARIHKLRGYLALGGNRGMDTQALNARVNDLEQTIDAYNRQYLWKRAGVAFWVPMYGQYQVTEYDYSSSPDKDTRVTNSRALYQDFSKSAVALTYDIADLVTLSLGVNLERKLFLGVSVDVSSPTSDFLASFRNELKPLRTPLSSGYEP